MDLNRSKHACVRMQQRGVDDGLVQVLSRYGRLRHSNGACITDMDKRSLADYLSNHEKPNRQIVEKLKKTYIVEINGKLVTVAYKKTDFKKKF